MKIKLIDESKKEEFDSLAPHPIQSWQWGEFRKEMGNKVIRLGFYDKNKLSYVCQITATKIPLINLWFGTYLKGSLPTSQVLSALREIAKREQMVAIKMEPFQAMRIDNREIIKKERYIHKLRTLGAISGKTLFTPTTFWIDLTKKEEELLQNFHPKTRYNIRLAQRSGVKIIEDNSDMAFEKYIQLTRQTTARQGFFAHNEKYHRLMWKHLNKFQTPPIARLLTAVYKGEIIVTWIVFVWKNFLYYPYGASDDKYKNTMASNLMMWEAIRLGKKLGLTTFDLWGREIGKGFTRFKEGYRPQLVEFLGSWDLVTNPFYYIYRLVEGVRWKYLRIGTRLGIIKPSF